MFAPAGLPADTLQRLNRAFVEAINTRERSAGLATLMAEPMPGTPDQFAQFVRRESAKYETVVKASGAKVD